MTASPSLAIGPLNAAGQGKQWADAVNRHTSCPAFNFVNDPVPTPLATLRGVPARYVFPADRHLPHHRLTPDALKPWLLRRLLRGVTHLAVESGASVLRRQDTHQLADDYQRLCEDFRLEVAYASHGSDLRDDQLHPQIQPRSYYREASREWLDIVVPRARRNRDFVRDTGLVTFVPTPDLLLEDYPSTWLPITVDVDRWAGGPPILRHDAPPVVLHLPSSRTPPIKGSDLIDPALRSLHDQGVIRYLAPERVAPAAMVGLVQQADVVVEQVRCATYATAAIEAMAAGRVVVSDVPDVVMDAMPERPPVITVPDGDVVTAIRQLVADRDTMQVAAERCAHFARTWHDGRAAARVLARWIGVEPPAAPDTPAT